MSQNAHKIEYRDETLVVDGQVYTERYGVACDSLSASYSVSIVRASQDRPEFWVYTSRKTYGCFRRGKYRHTRRKTLHNNLEAAKQAAEKYIAARVRESAKA